MAISPDGTRIVSASDDETLKMWDASDVAGGAIATGSTDPTESVDGRVTALAYSGDGTRIVTSNYDSTIKLWDASNLAGGPIATGSGHSTYDVRAVAFSTDGTFIVSGGGYGDNRVLKWNATDLTSGPLDASMAERGHTDTVKSVAISDDGRRIVSGSGDKTIAVWDATDLSQGPLATGTGHTYDVVSVAWSGNRIVSGGDATVKNAAHYDQNTCMTKIQ